MNNDLHKYLLNNYHPDGEGAPSAEEIKNADVSFALVMIIETEDGVHGHSTVVDPAIPEVTHGSALPHYSIGRRALVVAMRDFNEKLNQEIQRSIMLHVAQQEFGTYPDGLPKIPGMRESVDNFLSGGEDEPTLIQRLFGKEIDEE